MEKHVENKEKRHAQKILAKELTSLVHGENIREALESTKLLFHTDIKNLV